MKKFPSDPPGRRAARPPVALRGKPGKSTTGKAPFTAAELRRISNEITTNWFRPVEANRLTLLEIDPWRLHAYWTVAETDFAAAKASLPGDPEDATLVLRFTDLSPRTNGTPPHGHFDIEVEQASNNWYIDLWRDAKHYAAALGWRGADGTFVSLARSNEVVTPRGGPSPELAFRNMEVRTPGLPGMQPSAVSTAPAANDALLLELFPKRLLPEDGYPLALPEASDTILDEPAFPKLDAAPTQTTAPDQPAAAEEPSDGRGFPAIGPAEIEHYRTLAKKTKLRVLSNIATHLPPVAPDTVSPTDVELIPQPLPEWASVPEAAPGDLPADTAVMDEATVETASTAEDVFGAYDDNLAYDLLAKPEPPYPPATTATGQPHLPLEAMLASTVFSPGRDDSPVEVSAHLVIQGRGTPDSSLLLLGERVRVQADGSFRVELPLDHGPELSELLHRLRGRFDDGNDH